MQTAIYVGAPLPNLCPPSDATPFAEGTKVLRLVSSKEPGVKDFVPSSQEPHKHRPRACDECRWSSLSVWADDTPPEVLMDIMNYPKNSHLKFVATLKVGPQAGMALAYPNKVKHLSLWMLASFSPHLAVVNISDPNG